MTKYKIVIFILSLTTLITLASCGKSENLSDSDGTVSASDNTNISEPQSSDFPRKTSINFSDLDKILNTLDSANISESEHFDSPSRTPTNLSDLDRTLNTLDSANTSESNYSGLPSSEIAQSTTDISNIDLNHTYATRFEEVNRITFDTFYFDYPDNWTVKNEEVTQSTEVVTLTNDRGVTITYWYFGVMRDLTGPTRGINCVDVTKVTDVISNFHPSYVQAGDYSDLGPFMIAKLKVTGQYDVETGGEYEDVKDGSVRYALLPESQVGEQEEWIRAGLPTFSFWYAGHISVIADAPYGEFTEQEEKEVTAILSSFRNTPTPSNPSDNPS